MAFNFLLRGAKEIWAERPILYLEVFISMVFFISVIVSFFKETNNSMESRYVDVNTLFVMRNLRIFEYMVELEDY